MHIIETEEKQNPTARKIKSRICPRCQTNTGKRTSRPKLIKWLLFWLPVKMYRCKTCNKKFMLLGT